MPEISNVVFACIIVISTCSSIFYHHKNHQLSEQAITPLRIHYQLRSRTLGWIKQICIIFIILITSANTWKHHSRNSCHKVHHIVFSNVSVAGSLILSLFCEDSARSYRSVYVNYMWLPTHGLILIYFVFQLTEFSACKSDLFDEITLSVAIVLHCIGIFSYILSELEQYRKQIREPTAEFTTGLYGYLSFSFVNDLIQLANSQGKLEVDDMPSLSDDDCCAVIYLKVDDALSSKTNSNLLRALYEPIKVDFLHQVVLQLLRSVFSYVGPLCLQCILQHISKLESASVSGSQSTAPSPLFDFSPYTAAGLLLVTPIFISFLHAQFYHKMKRNEMRVRAALVSLLYKKGLRVDQTYLADGVGSVNNLISVDAKQIQEVMGNLHELWGTVLETVICLSLLYVVLGLSALSGVAVLVGSIPMGGMVAKYLDKYQNELLVRKDERMGVITEILNGMRILKVRRIYYSSNVYYIVVVVRMLVYSVYYVCYVVPRCLSPLCYLCDLLPSTTLRLQWSFHSICDLCPRHLVTPYLVISHHLALRMGR